MLCCSECPVFLSHLRPQTANLPAITLRVTAWGLSMIWQQRQSSILCPPPPTHPTLPRDHSVSHEGDRKSAHCEGWKYTFAFWLYYTGPLHLLAFQRGERRSWTQTVNHHLLDTVQPVPNKTSLEQEYIYNFCNICFCPLLYITEALIPTK